METKDKTIFERPLEEIVPSKCPISIYNCLKCMYFQGIDIKDKVIECEVGENGYLPKETKKKYDEILKEKIELKNAKNIRESES